MTIALGVRATNGIVVAADRQETVGYQKNDAGKITATSRLNPSGTLIVTGAGTGTYLDAIAQRLQAWFGDDKVTRTPAEIGEVINDLNRKFYAETVLPFATYAEQERPDYSLLIGCDVPAGPPVFFTTEKLSLKGTTDYDAVGVGAATAKALLSKFYVRLPVAMAINLVAFVMYEVKASIEGCGLGTDILYTSGHVMTYLPDEEVREMEDAFRDYHRSERENLHHCIASDLSHDARPLAEDQHLRGKLKDIFGRLNEGRLKRMSPPMPNT
jgi:20S proteasome alpha/beta subunit